VDLLLFHAIQYPDDPERILDPERGALRAALLARKAGQVRFLGFSGHMYPKSHLDMLATPQPWDAVLMPLNVLDAHYRSFEKSVLPECRRRDIGVLGMKSLAAQNGRLPRELGIPWELCRRYALSLPIASLVCGLQTREQLRALVGVARDFKPLTPAEVDGLLDTARGPAQSGAVEQYKNPQGGFGCSHHSAVLKAAAASPPDQIEPDRTSRRLTPLSTMSRR
jgi:predicted aldo/keto reductase-like oxidoreductase